MLSYVLRFFSECDVVTTCCYELLNLNVMFSDYWSAVTCQRSMTLCDQCARPLSGRMLWPAFCDTRC